MLNESAETRNFCVILLDCCLFPKTSRDTAECRVKGFHAFENAMCDIIADFLNKFQLQKSCNYARKSFIIITPEIITPADKYPRSYIAVF